MKQTLLDNIQKPIRLFQENGGIVGVCEKGGRLLGQTIKGFFSVAKFVVEPPVSAVILAGLITVDYLKKDGEKNLLTGIEFEPIKSDSNIIVDLNKEYAEKRISKGAKFDIEQLLGLSVFDFNTFRNQCRKKKRQYHPDSSLGNKFIFNEFEKLIEEIRWTWFVDYKNLSEEDKQQYELMTNPVLRSKSYLYVPKYSNSQLIGGIKVINTASCADDIYYCRNIETNEIIELTEDALSNYAQV